MKYIWLILIFLGLGAVPGGASFDLPSLESAEKNQEAQGLESLLNILKKEETRQAFIKDLDHFLKLQKEGKLQQSPTEEEEESIFQISTVFDHAFESSAQYIQKLHRTFLKVATLLETSQARKDFWEACGRLILMLTLGLMTFGSLLFLFQKTSKSFFQKQKSQQGLKGLLIVGRFFLEMISLGGFLATSLATTNFLIHNRSEKQVAFILIFSVLLNLVSMRSFHLLLGSEQTAISLFTFKEQTAKRNIHFLNILLSSMIYSVAVVQIFSTLRIGMALPTAVVKFLILILAFKAILFCFQSREDVASWILGSLEKDRRFLNRSLKYLAHTWHLLLSAYIVILTAVFLGHKLVFYKHLALACAITTTLLVGLGAALIRMPAWAQLLLKSLPLFSNLDVKRRHTYRTFFSLSVGILLILISLLSLGEIWHLSFFKDFFALTHLQIFLKGFTIFFILMVGFVLWELCEYSLEHFLDRYRKASESAASQGRIKTLTPLLKNGFRSIVVLLVTLVLFSEFGLNITPLLAGASVLGIALSLGGQTLVRDVITGTFILIEDTMNIGDTILVNSLKGSVEALSLRTVHLRDSKGYMHIIPFSSINHFTNMSRNYVNCYFELSLSYKEDPDRISTLFKTLAEEMRQEKKYGTLILAPLVMEGIQSFGPQGFQILGTLKVKPDWQYEVEKEFNRRLKKAFEKEGIEFPYPYQVVKVINAKS